MTTIPGLRIALRYINWFVELIEEHKLGGEQVEARQPMIAEIMRAGYEPTPEMLEAVRRACGVFYPKITVLVSVRIGVLGRFEADNPSIDIDLLCWRKEPHRFVMVYMVSVTGGAYRSLTEYLTELRVQGYQTAGALVTSAYLHEMRSRSDKNFLPFTEFYYNEGDRVMNEKGQTGITSDSMRDFDCSGSSFLVVKR